MILADIWKRWAAFFEEEPADEPRYDPIHLAAVLVAVLAAVGALFWLLWTLLVFEGGLGAEQGRAGNVVALLILIAVVEALRRADRRHARKHE